MLSNLNINNTKQLTATSNIWNYDCFYWLLRLLYYTIWAFRRKISVIQPFSTKQYSSSNTKSSVLFTATPTFSNCDWFILTTKVRFIEIQNSFISQNIRIRLKALKKKIFLQKSFMHYSQKTKKKKKNFPHYILGIVMVSISLPDESIKILKI